MPYFCVFAGDWYYPGGGIDDLRPGYFMTKEEAVIFAVLQDRDWWSVVEVSTEGLKEVEFG